MKKLIALFILFLGLSVTSFAQADKIREKATEKVEELNSQIIAGDESLALSDEQRDQVTNIHIERIKEYRKAKKEGATDEEIKVIQNKHFQKIYNEVLTKEQKQARKKGKEK